MLTSLLFFFLAVAPLQESVTPDCITPKVASCSLTKGSFILPEKLSYLIEGEQDNAFIKYLEASELKPVKVSGKKADLRFKIGPKALPKKPEGAYSVVITPKGITVSAADAEGAFYALQSILQLARAAGNNPIAACKIEDAPRYQHRGLMFDVVRHFHSKEFILRQLDVMAMLKMNKFHFHLTDNEAWRIKLDSAPEMAEKGAFGDSWFFNNVMSYKKVQFADEPKGYRSGTVWDDGRIYGGYYSKDDIREIIAYASERHIEVIPEIELPGHNMALLHVHPEFFCSGEHKVDNVFCPGLDEVFPFFEAVLSEVMDLFPSKYIHIGGDEAAKDNWRLCPRCRERMDKEGLKDVFELQSYIIRRIDKFVTSKGESMIGWDEILEGGLSENATVMSWRGTTGGVKSLREHHDVIMTPNTYYYLDYGQDAPYKEPIAFNAYLPLETVYGYEPEKDIIEACGGVADPEILGHLLGVQGNLWSECIISDAHYEYMLYPRAFAIAETGWSPLGSKDYAAFRVRALSLIDYLKAHGYNPFDLANEVGDRPEAAIEIPRLTCDAKATWKIGSGAAAEDASILVDGRLGGWNINNKGAWKETRRRKMVVDIDLGSVKDIHYLGAEFVDYGARRITAPADTEFYISSDGVNYSLVSIPQAKLSPERRHFQILTIGAPVSEHARYVRLRFNGSDRRVRARISEVIVN